MLHVYSKLMSAMNNELEAVWQELTAPYYEGCKAYEKCSTYVRGMLLPGLEEQYEDMQEFATKHPEYRPRLPKHPNKLKNFLYFWDAADPVTGFLSPHDCSTRFTDDSGNSYSSVYEYVLYKKAEAAGAPPSECEARSKQQFKESSYAFSYYGGEMRDNTWLKNACDVVKTAYTLKFSGNRLLRQKLLNTHGAVLVATSAHDKVWGVGLVAEAAALCENECEWRGKNWLGQCIMDVRTELRTWAPDTREEKRARSNDNPIEIEIEEDDDTEVEQPPAKLQKTDHSTIEIWTDGACSSNGREDASGGIGVFFADGDPRNLSEALTDRHTNQVAELQAAIRGIEICLNQSDAQRVLLHTDSKYVIDCVTKWIHAWHKNDWKTAKGYVVKNKALVSRLYELAFENDRGVSVEFKYVRAHDGNYGNEQADRLAKQACK